MRSGGDRGTGRGGFFALAEKALGKGGKRAESKRRAMKIGAASGSRPTRKKEEGGTRSIGRFLTCREATAREKKADRWKNAWIQAQGWGEDGANPNPKERGGGGVWGLRRGRKQ